MTFAPLFPRCLFAARALVAACALALAACGGGGDTPSAAPAAVGSHAVVAPLLADDGSLAADDPSARPADSGAWTRAGRYARAEQARQLAEALGDDAITIDVGCCDAVAMEQSVGLVWALQAARDLPRSVPVMVRGQDLRLAAAAVNRLADGGLTHVWLVTP